MRYASQYGNNAYIAPQATLTDGLLDVTILEPFTVLDVPSLAFQLFNKTIDQNSRIKTFRCRRLCIRRPLRVWYISTVILWKRMLM